jgi:negative regulator of flagellin synthesis FlgM
LLTSTGEKGMAVDITGLPATPLSNNATDSGKAVSTGNRENQTPVSSGERSSVITDVVTLTRHAENLRVLEAGFNAQSKTDSQRIASLKSAIDMGQYNIDPLRVAEKLMRFESELVQ